MRNPLTRLVPCLVGIPLVAFACANDDTGLFSAGGSAGASGGGGRDQTAGRAGAGASTAGGRAGEGAGGNGGSAAKGGSGGSTAKGGAAGSTAKGGSAGEGDGGSDVGGASGDAGKGGSAGKGDSGAAGKGNGGAAGKGDAGSGGKGEGGAAGNGNAGSAGKGGDGSCATNCSELDGPCVVGTCKMGTCAPVPKDPGATCDDGNPCTTGETCVGTVCQGTPKECGIGLGVCAAGVCDASTGACLTVPANEGNPCDDQNAATEKDKCTAGVCTGTAVQVEPLRLIEVNTLDDFLVLKNTGTTPLQLSGYRLLINQAALTSSGGTHTAEPFDIVLPTKTLAPGANYFVYELDGDAGTGDFEAEDSFYWTGDGAGVWLCKGACTGSTIVDLFEMGKTKEPVPSSVSFAPAIAAQNGKSPIFVRKDQPSTPPAFSSAIWAVGTSLRP